MIDTPTPTSSLPSLFLSHGSPMLALEEEPTTRFLRHVARNFIRPDAIVVASAHWETEHPTVTASAHPATIHDFRGFPPALYAMRYPAPGDPVLAKEVAGLLQQAGAHAAIDETRGLDHGVWNPLILMYPEADIPVIELSVQPHRDARHHYQMGQALRPLVERNILVIGTGNLTHNLYEAFRGHHPQPPEWVNAFANWIHERLEDGDTDALLDWQARAPYARENHPSPEHFLPFFVALGAGHTPIHATRLHSDTSMGVLAMDAYAF